ncbi:T9SS type B sorting domain-containing protein [Tenacibaculum insulae]|uniref:T9SS type B sorting domain-containing protein n=1 Tax=Tenacibaculum insulae TaxID=2029677 RepID=UPI003AB2386A
MKKFITLFIFLSSLFSFSQRETDNWYFGDKAGLHFNKGRLDILNDSKMNVINGSSSISDNQGNLLFYTNGQTVWNKKHQIMEDGEGLAGELDNSQSSIIIPKPNSNSTYYIFTTRKTKSEIPLIFPGIYYSEVEFSTTHPNGKVINKKQRLSNSYSQKITAVHHKNGKDIWVVTYGSKVYQGINNLFLAFKITEFGIDLPIKTELNEIESLIGEMKASPDGSKIVLSTNLNLFLYNFNNTTGSLSKFKYLTLLINFTEGFSSFGVSFSPNSKILYYPSYKSTSAESSYNIMQLELSHPDVNYRGSSIFKSPPTRNNASIQLGSDGKIYVAQVITTTTYDDQSNSFVIKHFATENISVIREPNKLGTNCNYRHDAINLENGFSYRGLPNFIQSYFRNRIVTENKCVSDVFDFSLDAYKTITDATWDFGDGNTATGLATNHQYTAPGSYMVTANVTINSNIIPFYKEIIVYPLPTVIPNQKLIQCDANNDGVDYFDLNDINNKVVTNTSDKSFIFFKNITDAQNNTNKISNPEIFQNESNPQELFVKVISDKSCSNITNFFIESMFVKLGDISNNYICDSSDQINGDLKGTFNLENIQLKIKNDFNLNNFETVRFFPSLIDAQTTSNLIDVFTPFTTPTTTVYVRVDTSLGCGGIEPMQLIVNPVPKITINNAYTLCFKPNLHTPIILDGDISNDRFEWRNEAGNVINTNREFTLTKTGNYSLTVYKTENGIECSNYKEFSATNLDSPSFNQIIVDTETTNNTIFVSVNGNSNYEFSLDNITFFNNGLSHTFNNVTPGVQTVYVNDINNCEPPVKIDVSVIGFLKFFTPNDDNINDFWTIKGASNQFFKNIKVSIFDRFGKVLYTLNNNNIEQGWNGTFNGKKLPSNDYWYHAKLIDLNDKKIEEKGHFSIRKN